MWPEQAKFISSKMSSIVIYEIIDDHELISNADEIWYKTHNEWVKKADIVVTTADDLLEKLRPDRPDTILLPNGVCIDDWRSTGQSHIMEDMVAARKASVVVGYFGSIAEWFDWKMWEYAAKTKPDWSFVLIGPPYDGDVRKINDRINHYPNMYYLGAKPYKNLANYLLHFDIATIPFILNQITHSCSPIKLFEYMAAGKPIVASPMREILKYQSILSADSPEAFVNQLDKALLLKEDPEYCNILKKEAEENTWRSRAEVLRKAIESVRIR
jgi:glycosyltransferase involved in cell wall biosynthesis